MTVEQSARPLGFVQPKSPEERSLAQIREITGIDDAHVIKEAIDACKSNDGKYTVEDVVSVLLQDSSVHTSGSTQTSPQPVNKESEGTAVVPSEPVLTCAPKSEKTESEVVWSTPVPVSSAPVIDLTKDKPDATADGDDIQKAIVASLQDNQGILGGQVTREEQDISRVLEASLAESKAGTKRKRGDIWFVDPLNPHERKRQESWPVGLKNVGNTCWFSAVIQSLFHLRRFRHMVLNFHPPKENGPGSSTEKRNLRFMQELRHLFGLMVGTNRKYVDPSRAVEILKEAFSSSQGVADSQQDVSEFQHKLLEWLEDAFKGVGSRASSPTENENGCCEKKIQNPVVDLFYGEFKAEGINEGKGFTNQETFGQFPLQVNGYEDIHESLEGATAQGEIETVNQDPSQKSVQELWFTRLPPVLTFELSRFQFNQQAGRPEKIHNKLHFPQIIYLDRYLELNKSKTRQRREEVKKLKDQLQKLHRKLDKFLNYGSSSKRFPLQDILQSALDFAETKREVTCSMSLDVEMESPKPSVSTQHESPVKSPPDVTMASPNAKSPLKIQQSTVIENPAPRNVSDEELHVLRDCLQRWRTEVESDVRELQENISSLEETKNLMYSGEDMKQYPYDLHAVLVHEGQAASGHYWAYVYDTIRQIWLKYNDITVTEASWDELEKEGNGGYHNTSAYCLMYVDKSRIKHIESSDIKNVQEEIKELQEDLNELVVEDNKKFSEEIEEWDKEQNRKNTQEADCTVISENKLGHPGPTFTPLRVQPSKQTLPKVHAQLSFKETMEAVSRVIDTEVFKIKSPREIFENIAASEMRRLELLAKQCPSLIPRDDPRLRHMLVYLLINRVPQQCQIPVLLEQFVLNQILDHNPRSKEIRLQAEKFLEGMKAANKKDEEKEKMHEFWHEKYDHFRRTAYMFVRGLESFYQERYAEALPYLNHAVAMNLNLVKKNSEMLGFSKKLLSYFRRQCVLHLNDIATHQFGTEADVADALMIMNNFVVPSMAFLSQSCFQDDTAAVEEIREKWCSFLGQEDLDCLKSQKLEEFLSKLFDSPADLKDSSIPTISASEMTELYICYKHVMELSHQSGYIENAEKTK